jgi:hypothetical protein
MVAFILDLWSNIWPKVDGFLRKSRKTDFHFRRVYQISSITLNFKNFQFVRLSWSMHFGDRDLIHSSKWPQRSHLYYTYEATYGLKSMVFEKIAILLILILLTSFLHNIWITHVSVFTICTHYGKIISSVPN